ncbi:extracellular solute-binding protein [Guptibacillus hwajinpoensis]|uniref:Sugar ABC transporter substrate-binding protein n=1 Tax=Guptibacillus hwajinpoensis TaxID=208199 RepID=A0A0J6D225_9BACL|nr:extracellular solute-binding protein [Alkalihalobacillus macyae]KMM39353.1 sugar ABC transporter substrate-binding protein [Alkalihalobacillus macyae]
MKKFSMRFIMLMVIVSIVASGCQSSNSGGGSGTEDGIVTINFWAATNPSQQAFWTDMADKYMKENDEVKIEVSPMPESPSSEAGIQSAIAAGNAPTISENISRGFAAQLAASSAIVPLSEFEGYEDLIKSREMTETVSTWKFSDDNQYVLPIYSNAMLFGWRIDILNELGFDAPPETYSEVLEVGKKMKEQDPEKFLWARADLVKPTWWARWFDFFMVYNAASEGNKFVEGSEFTAGDKAGIETLEFFKNLNENELLLTRDATDPFETGQAIMRDIGPWTFPYWADKFPEMKMGENFELSMPPVPDDVDPANSKTFADSKGLSIYASASKEQQQAAFDFITWVYSDAENDMKWFEETNLPPARDDLSTNDTFKAYFDKNPQLVIYAENIPNAVPPIDNEKTVEVQELIGKEALIPVLNGEKEPKAAWNDMKEAINGELK